MTALKQTPPDEPEPAAAELTQLAAWRQKRARQIQELRLRGQALVTADPAIDPQKREELAVDERLWEPDLPMPPTSSKSRRWTRLLTRSGKRNPAPTDAPNPSATPSDASTPPGDDTFAVPRAGKQLRRAGRGRTWTTRLVLISSPLILIGGLAYSCGVATGSSRIQAPSAITANEADAYHLSTYPAAQASAYGAAYLTLCLTHPSVSADQAIADRLTALARMTSAGVVAGCGWDGTGTAQQPLSVTWTGVSAPSAGSYSSGTAAQLSYIVVMSDRRTMTVALPVWASSSNGQPDFRVVGDLSLLPAAAPETAPEPVPPAVVDPSLADSLGSTVLLPFLQAWAASDPVQLNLILAGGASTVAQQGLEGQLSNPQLDTAQVVVNHGTVGKYREGDRITAQVTVGWNTATSAGVQTASYSIPLQLTAGKWLVLDINGGPVDSQGGAADNTTYQSTSAPSSSTPTQ